MEMALFWQARQIRELERIGDLETTAKVEGEQRLLSSRMSLRTYGLGNKLWKMLMK